jgi:protein-disulfide isomerase
MTRVALVLTLTAAVLGMSVTSHAGDKSALTDAQKAAVKELVREYILENPEIINQAIDVLDARATKGKEDQRKAVISARKQELFNPAEGTIIGNPKGDVTIVEFFDYNCGYCKSMHQTLKDFLKQDTKVRVVLKEYPILGPGSLTASKAALAARKQGKYAPFHVALLDHKGGLTEASVMDIAGKVGLDVAKLKSDMDDKTLTDILLKNHDLAAQLGIDGTPSLIIGDTFVPGAIAKDKLVELVATARK